jgi:nitronate monooxygenase
MNETSVPNAEILGLLNTLLEAERAGAKVLSEFLADYPEDSEAWRTLRKVQRDEAENCAILMRLIRGVGAEPSKATGDFVAKALAVEGNAARLAFLNRGQGWVARKIREALPGLGEGEIRTALVEMQDSHVANIATCDALVASMPRA